MNKGEKVGTIATLIAIFGVLAYCIIRGCGSKRGVQIVLRDDAGNIIEQSGEGQGGIFKDVETSRPIDCRFVVRDGAPVLQACYPIEVAAEFIGAALPPAPPAFPNYNCPTGHHVAVKVKGGKILCAKD